MKALTKWSLSIILFTVIFMTKARESVNNGNEFPTKTDNQDLTENLIFEGGAGEALKYSSDSIAHVFVLGANPSYQEELKLGAKQVQQIIEDLSRGKITPAVFINYNENIKSGMTLSSMSAGRSYTNDEGEAVFDASKLTKDDFKKFLIHYLSRQKELKN